MKLTTNVPHYDALIELVTVKANELKHDVLHLFISIEATVNTGVGLGNALTFNSKFRAKKEVDKETEKYLEKFCGRSAVVREETLDEGNKIEVYYCDEALQIDRQHDIKNLEAVAESIVNYIFALKGF